MLWRGKRLQVLLFSHLKKMGEARFFFQKSATPHHSPTDTWYTLAFLHNISTPLSVLSSLVDDVLPDLPPSVAKTLQTTVRTLLQSTQLHGVSLTGQWRRESFEICRATESILPLLQSLSKPYEVVVILPHKPIFVFGTLAAWEEILVNLVKNSTNSLLRENIPGNTGKIWLKLTCKKNTWHLYWYDSGPGIPISVWKKLQNPLSQTTPHTSKHGYGMRSVQFWWRQAFSGDISLHHEPWWSLHFQAPLQ